MACAPAPVRIVETGLVIHPAHVELIDGEWTNPAKCKSVTVAIADADSGNTVTIEAENSIEYEAQYVEGWTVDDKNSVLAEGAITVTANGTARVIINYTYVD